MRKFSLLLLLLTATVLLLYGPTLIRAQSSANRNVPPIFSGTDGIADPPLNLFSAYACDYPVDPGTELQSTQYTYYKELWNSSTAKDPANDKYFRTVLIERWQLQSPNDPAIFPKYHLVLGQLAFPGWSPVAEIGTKTFWYTSGDLFFVKGTSLVRITVRPREIGREYTATIARAILNKL